jgi:hypothetical protein
LPLFLLIFVPTKNSWSPPARGRTQNSKNALVDWAAAGSLGARRRRPRGLSCLARGLLVSWWWWWCWSGTSSVTCLGICGAVVQLPFALYNEEMVRRTGVAGAVCRRCVVGALSWGGGGDGFLYCHEQQHLNPCCFPPCRNSDAAGKRARSSPILFPVVGDLMY